jgi:hypothetical protein
MANDYQRLTSVGASPGRQHGRSMTGTPRRRHNPLRRTKAYQRAGSCQALSATLQVTQIHRWAILLSVKREWTTSIESWRIALCIFFLAITLILKVFTKTSLRNIGLALLAVMLVALAYSVYRIIEDRKSQ